MMRQLLLTLTLLAVPACNSAGDTGRTGHSIAMTDPAKNPVRTPATSVVPAAAATTPHLETATFALG